MNRQLLAILLIGITGGLSFGATSAYAYEEETHEILSAVAAENSVLKNKSEILTNLGLKPWSAAETFPNSEGQPRTITQLFREGARFEDDTPRPVNHFYDPLNDRPLSVGLHIGYRSPDWALEDKTDFSDQQEYSYRDAYDYLYKALTLLNEKERKKNIGLTFQTLGHVIHHIHDMAQPQHVRNDQHLDFDSVDWPWLENPSFYEQYTKDHPDKLMLLFSFYPPVNGKDDLSFLTTARSFWHTGQGGGLGLAEFTNSNLVSAGTNFDANLYPSPSRAQATAHDEPINNLFQKEGLTVPPECLPPSQPCVMTFYRTRIQDNYRPTASKDNDYTSTLSIFDQDLRVQNKRAFSLNRFNFNAAHEFLIPRAVAYSAGLIDYFFRGHIEVEDAHFTNAGISLRVRNAIDPDRNPEWKDESLYAQTGSGKPSTLTVTYEYQDEQGVTRHVASNPVALAADPNNSANADNVAPGAVTKKAYAFTLAVPFVDPNHPRVYKDLQYRLVYRGRMGQENDRGSQYTRSVA